MTTDGLPGRPYLLCLFILCILLSMLASMIQEVVDDDDIEKMNQYQAETRWLHIFCGFWIVFLPTLWIPLSFPIVAILAIYLNVFITIQLPKRLVHTHKWDASVLKIYQGIHPIIHILALPIQISTFFADEDVSEEDIREMIHVGSESGNIKQAQTEMIQNIFEMDDITIEEICTHRSDVIMLHLEDSAETWKQIIHDNRHTFYPICREDEDDIIGVLDTRDYFRLADTSSQDVILNHAMDAPFFEAESCKVDHLFKEMTAHKNYFAIVLDEYGGMTGICTLHDIMESLVGEIYEEDELDRKEIQRIDSNQWRIYGSAEIEDVEQALGISLHDDDENETFNGYILSQYGRIPENGSQFEIRTKDLLITVKEVKNHRIEQTIVQLSNDH